MNPSDIVMPILVIEHAPLTHEETILNVAVAAANIHISHLIVKPLDEDFVTSFLGVGRATSKFIDAKQAIAELQEDPFDYWDEWLSGRFTKTVRRVKVLDFAKLEETERHTRFGSAVAFSPRRYSEFNPVLKRAQVQGLDYPRTNHPLNFFADTLIVLNPHVPMTTGKAAAQAAHALMAYDIQTKRVSFWRPYSVGLTYHKNFDKLKGIIEIHDAGFTEVPAGTCTAKVINNVQEEHLLAD